MAARPGLRGSKLDPWKPLIDRLVQADTQSSRRRSVRKICEELGITGISIETVTAYVSARRRELRAAQSEDSSNRKEEVSGAHRNPDDPAGL